MEHFENNQGNVDIVVIDARMPKMTGFQLARMIKKVSESVLVILISAFEMNKKEFDSVLPSTHIDGFLTKPFHVNQLVEVIKTVDAAK